MKKILSLLLLLCGLATAQANNVTSSTSTTQTINVTGSAYDISFNVGWWSDDFPMFSAPGRLDLLDSGGQLVGRVIASDYEGSGSSVTVSGPGSVDNVQSNIGRYAGGTPADGFLSGVWHLTGLTPGSYTLRLWDYRSWDTLYSATTVWTNTSFVSGSEPAPTNTAPTISWISAPATAPHAQGYYVAAHGHDDDGNLAQVNVWKNGVPFAFAGGGNGTDGDSGNATSDAGPQTVTFTAQVVDSSGAASAMISFTVSIGAPPPSQYSLTTTSGPGGSVSPGGSFSAGSTAMVVATPDAAYDFAGWSGSAGGSTNPLGVAMDGDKAVQANFTPKTYTLTTSAMSGGSTTPGGSYPYGTTVSISATPDAAHYFTSWTGDAAGTATSIVVLLDRAKFVQAQFAPKAAQSISFSPPGDQNVGATIPLSATASSGLPVNFVVLSGPANFSWGTLTVTGPGAITIQAVQPGDTYTLAAPPVTGTFNAAAPAMLRYQAAARTLLQTGRTAEATNYVIGNP